MITKILKRIYLKPNSYQRDCIEIWQTSECYVIPYISFENIMNIIRKGRAYVRLGWLHWSVEYFKDSVISSGCDDEDSQTNTTSEEN